MNCEDCDCKIVVGKSFYVIDWFGSYETGNDIALELKEYYLVCNDCSIKLIPSKYNLYLNTFSHPSYHSNYITSNTRESKIVKLIRMLK